MSGRIMLAGTNSGCGKTTVTLALLSALTARGMKISAFKCGPDYIDPMFHRTAIGISSRNLDPYFCSGEQLQRQLADAAGLAVIEGVMGYYDGIGAKGRASSYELAQHTNTPVILILNVQGMYSSAGAVLKGFTTFRPHSGIRGVIFNAASPMLYSGLRQIAAEAGLLPLGFLPKQQELVLESRHLGLVTADEIPDIKRRLSRLGELAEQCLDIDAILALAHSAEQLAAPPPPKATKAAGPRPRIAIARDEAFCFLYQENLDLLQELGCELQFFSPLRDSALPENISGLYLPGGYPELHIRQLAANTTMLAAIRAAVAGGLPTIAECGGFLYLHQSVDGFALAGVIPAAAHKTDKLQRFGYIELTAQQDNLLCRRGESIRAHEFHYYDSSDYGCGFVAQKASGRQNYPCIHATPTLYAGFPHLYFPANTDFAREFVRKASQYGAGKYS